QSQPELCDPRAQLRQCGHWLVVLMTRSLVLPLLVAALLSGDEQAPPRPRKVIRITAERFVFSPSRIKVKQGTEVEFAVTSEDTHHGFHIPAANIDAAIPQQGTGELTVRVSPH